MSYEDKLSGDVELHIISITAEVGTMTMDVRNNGEHVEDEQPNTEP